MHERSTAQQRRLLKAALLRSKMGPAESVSAFVARVRRQARTLVEQHGEDVREEDMFSIVVDGLCSEFDVVVTAVETMTSNLPPRLLLHCPAKR